MPPEKEVVEDRGDLLEPIENEDELEDEEVEELDDVEEEEDGDEEDSDVDDKDEDDDEEDSEDDEEEADDPSEEEHEDDEDDSEDDESVADEEGQRIPKSRLDQVIKQREEERERNLWLQEQLEAMIQRQTAVEEKVEEEVDEGPPDYDFDEAEGKYIELILEGEVKDATMLRREINKAREEVYNYQIESVRKNVTSEAVDKTTQSLDEQRFNGLLTSYVEQYDFLNDESDAYNAKAVTMANKLMASYLQEGKRKSEALKLAVDDILPFYNEEKPEVKPKANTATARKKQARKKAAKASQSQPPASKGRTGKTARSLDSIDIAKMSDKDYNSLTARERAKLRGDIV
ncbi:MAG: hypothetical protein KJO69_06170 [Gammaproteobacteria bacterium]|nr:hypothetical protein [Gammaproteobacteria bacterium]